MAVSEAQKRANAKYRKEHTHLFSMRFSDAEKELWDRVQSQPNKAGYIKRLIREDIERNS